MDLFATETSSSRPWWAQKEIHCRERRSAFPTVPRSIGGVLFRINLSVPQLSGDFLCDYRRVGTIGAKCCKNLGLLCKAIPSNTLQLYATLKKSSVFIMGYDAGRPVVQNLQLIPTSALLLCKSSVAGFSASHD